MGRIRILCDSNYNSNAAVLHSYSYSNNISATAQGFGFIFVSLESHLSIPVYFRFGFETAFESSCFGFESLFFPPEDSYSNHFLRDFAEFFAHRRLFSYLFSNFTFAGAGAIVVRRYDRLRVARLDSIFRKTQQNRQRVLGAVQQRRRAAVLAQRPQLLARVHPRGQFVIAVPKDVDALEEDVHTAAGRITDARLPPSSTVTPLPRLPTNGAQFRTLLRHKTYVTLLLASVSADEILILFFITTILFSSITISLRIIGTYSNEFVRIFIFFLLFNFLPLLFSLFSSSLSLLFFFFLRFLESCYLNRQWSLLFRPF